MFYEKVFRELNARGVRYVVVGGVALVLHGIIRLTADLDLIVDLSPENLRLFLETLKSLGFRPRLPITLEEILDPEKRSLWRREKNLVMISFYHPQNLLYQVDFFAEEPLPFTEIAQKIIWKEARDIKIPVASKELLKKLKTLSGRPQDLKDLEALEDLDE
ncbi:hypothetical protein FVE67_02805 [Thermosulfurimonas marina]|uniref:Nucleotidyltransferase family protein n=1 Tax=Thermosulfurimonas marina TaxID=2047767 RepID=A0A6H1WRH7_9BACT|nr:hypothetical protein [Thermosulfurimonas marina]QJA05793.1 hypothetical protein FVE67_02805 [Thermosulfurimonas marina]